MMDKRVIEVLENTGLQNSCILDWPLRDFIIKINKNGDHKRTFLLSRYPYNCSMIVLYKIGNINNEELNTIITRLKEDNMSDCMTRIANGHVSAIQATVNNENDLSVFLSCGFEVISSYKSLGSGSTITIVLYKYPPLPQVDDDED